MKKVFAVTNVRHNNETFDAGSELDTAKFSKEELRALYDNGGVEIREIEEKVPEPEKVEEPAKPTKAAPVKVTGPDTSVKVPSA